MQILKLSSLLILSTLLIFSCQESIEEESSIDLIEEYIPNNDEIVFEELISEIDLNDSLRIGQSLFYSKEGGASVDVEIRVNEKDEMVKMEEEYTIENSPSIASNTFYFDKGKMISSKELFEEGVGEEAIYVEQITYYDKDENPILTKRKTANYEEELDFESYEVIDNIKCSYDRALAVLNQEGEYGTTFQGFVKEEPYLYIIVGEKKKDGYYSSLVVQYMTPLIKTLQENEVNMIGTPLQVEFETLNGEQGFEYQILMNVQRR